VTDDISGKGDPLTVLRLLWGKQPSGKRGPRPKLALADVVRTAIGITDSAGLGALTTRRVADELGISPMSLYTYVPGKDELLDLMLDAIYGELAPLRGRTWRARLANVAHQNWELALRHPWMLEVATHRPVLGPNVFAKYDRELAALSGLGLTEIEMDRTLTLILDYVSGAVRGAARERWVKERTGKSDSEWWHEVRPFLEQVFPHDVDAYPVASRVGPVVGEAYGVHDPAGAFAFGLERLLDGLALMIEKRQGARRRPRRK
jgi:AcrR family transcriptional regulator